MTQRSHGLNGNRSPNRKQRGAEHRRRVLEAYRSTPGTAGVVRRPDHLFANQLYDRGVPLATVENALTFAAARRSARPANAARLASIRSLAYFAPVIEEVLQLNVGQEYFQHLRNKLHRATPHGNSAHSARSTEPMRLSGRMVSRVSRTSAKQLAHACGMDDDAAAQPPQSCSKTGSL